MQNMNKVMDPQKLAATMGEFSKQSMKMDMSEEMSKSLTTKQRCLQLHSAVLLIVKH